MNPAIYFGDLLEPTTTVQKWQLLYQKRYSSKFVNFGTFSFSLFFFFFSQNSFALVSLDLFWSPSAKNLPGKKKKPPRIFFSK